MFSPIALPSNSMETYGRLFGAEALAELRQLAQPLSGVRVLNLSASGGDTADLLGAAVPLLVELGIDCRWQVIDADQEIAAVNKALRSALSGGSEPWTAERSDAWLRHCRMNAELLDEPFDFVIAHDPEPTGICMFNKLGAPERVGRWIWHCHMDLSRAQSNAWFQLAMQAAPYDAILFPSQSFLPPGGPRGDEHFVPPAVEPVAPRYLAELLRLLTKLRPLGTPGDTAAPQR